MRNWKNFEKLVEQIAKSMFDSKEAWIRDISSQVLPEEVFRALDNKRALHCDEHKNALLWIYQHVEIREARLTDYGTKLEYVLDGRVVGRAIFFVDLNGKIPAHDGGGHYVPEGDRTYRFIPAESKTTLSPVRE